MGTRKKPRWDQHPIVKKWKGKEIEVFGRSALALALNRQVGTIRALERRGVLCTPALKLSRGWWCYTRDQIEDLIRLVEKEGLMDPTSHRPFSEEFSVEAKKVLSRYPRV